MNGKGTKRYRASHEKIAKKLKLLFGRCMLCGNKDAELEAHHMNGKRGDEYTLLCNKCHKQITKSSEEISPIFSRRGFDVTVAYRVTNSKDWFDSRKPLQIIPNLKPEIANKFRRLNIKGFVSIGSCNYYIGVILDGLLIGVMGFAVPSYGNYDLLLKADTTISQYEHSTDLLLFMLRTKQVKKMLEDKFCREINNVYTMIFSRYKNVNRYRKHAKKIREIKDGDGFKVGYIFKMGTIPTLKAAISLFRQNYEKNKNKN